MSPTTKNLIWKQWQENKRYFTIFMAWMILAVCYCVGYELGHQYRAAIGHFCGLAMTYGIFAAIFLAMRTSLGEQADQTFAFSVSLPVNRKRVGLVRITGAILTLVIPILAAGLLLTIVYACGMIDQVTPRATDLENYQSLLQRETASLWTTLQNLWSVTVISIFSSIHLFLILCLGGCWLRSPAQIALSGALMAFAVLILVDFSWSGGTASGHQLISGAIFPQTLVVQWGYSDKSGSYTDHQIAPQHWNSVLLSLPWLFCIACLFIRKHSSVRVGTTSDSRMLIRLKIPSVFSCLSRRWPNRYIALIWSELRQSIPLAFGGLLFAILVAVFSLKTQQNPSYTANSTLFSELPGATWIIAMLWGVVVGSVLFSTELNANVGGFWRSRPIPVGMWFVCKFLIGLIAVIGVLDIVTILIAWNAPREGMTTGMSWSYVCCMPLLHALMYSLAVLGTCVLRKPVLGGIFAVLAFTVISIVLNAIPATMPFDPMNVFYLLLADERGLQNQERIGHFDLTQHGYPLVFGMMLISIIVMAIISSRLVKPLQGRFSGP